MRITCREADSRLASQDIIAQTPKVQHHVHKSLSLDPVLSQLQNTFIKIDHSFRKSFLFEKTLFTGLRTIISGRMKLNAKHR
jgi:hypothetical protein